MKCDWLAHYGIKGQKWGIRHGPPYPLNRGIYSRAKKVEPNISKDIQKVAQKNKVKLYGYEHRLKSKESINRKTKLGKEIKDAVRYTFILPDKTFVKKYHSITKDLSNLGYTETVLKNYFKRYSEGTSNHKSVQGNYKSKNGYEFEIQYQTTSSQDAKNKKVPLYEEVRNPNVTAKRKLEIVKLMNELANTVKDPDDIFKIQEH